MSSGYYRFPTIYEDKVVFVSEDDLWEVPAGGGVARRLTANLGLVLHPCFSPDGRYLAFSGREEGQFEVFVMPATGGPARRVTFMGAGLFNTLGWTPDGKIIFSSSAGHWNPSFTELYTVSLDGDPPEKLNYGPARSLTFGPGGGLVLGRNGSDPARWKRYLGGTAGQLFIDEDGSGEFRPLISLKGNLTCPMWIGNRIYFISDHEGIGNIYSCLPDGNDLCRHTDHETYYTRNASFHGRRIVYHSGADLYLFDTETDQGHLIPIEYYSPRVQRNRRFVDPARFLSDYNLHPSGQALAVATRGKAFTFANWEGAVRQHRAAPPPSEDDETPPIAARCRLPTWLNDGKRLLGVTDLDGEERFIIWNTDGNSEPEILSGLEIGRPEAIAANPVDDQIVFSNHRYELMWLDLSSRQLRIIDRGKAAPIAGFDWSPDGKWVAYSVSVSLSVMALKLWKVETGESFPVVPPLIRDVAPAFDPSGRYLYFLSYRSFDPVYDNIQFDLAFPRGMKPYLVTLQKDLLSPFIRRPMLEEECSEEESEEPQPEAEGQLSAAEDQEPNTGSEEEQADSSVADSSEPAPDGGSGDKPELKIDLEGIASRMVAFPIAEGIYGQVRGTKGNKVIYTRFPVEGSLQINLGREQETRGQLVAYNFDEQKEETLANGVSDFSISRNGSFLVYRSGSRLRVIRAGEKPAEESDQPSRRSGWINLDRIKVSVLPAAEWRQMFREAWRLQRDQFWNPEMSQLDWLAVHDRYLPLVDRVSSRSEFSDLMWEMQGELGTSHAYEFGGDYRPNPNFNQGYLGAGFEYDPESGGWRIVNILSGDPWDSRCDSPFNEPGINVSVGDVLVSVNGEQLSRHFSPAQALVNLAGEEVNLGIISHSEKTLCTVTVQALRSETPLRYRAWVEENRRRVHAATQDRVGYVHIPDMGPKGYAEFHRSFLSEVNRDGLIVDVRFNSGGHVSALLLEKLARRRLGYSYARWRQVPSPYPVESVLGPIVALTNEHAGSDGDIFCHGFKLLNLGPLIGKRTWGGVIGIWPRHSLVDGTLTTQPEFAHWFTDVGWGVENYGTEPDIEVDILPQDYARGADPQLERAIQEIQRLMAENPPAIPEIEPRPSRALPRLPRR